MIVTLVMLAVTALGTLAPIVGPYFIERAIAPLGNVKLAMFLSRLVSRARLLVDPALPAMHGAMAAYHARDRAAAADLVRAELREHRAIGNAGVVCAALLRDLAGDREGARALMESAREVHPEASVACATSVQQTWLLAEAAERGDFAAMRELAERTHDLFAPFLKAAARRLTLGEHGASDVHLWLTFILAARPTARPLLTRALAQRAPRAERESLSGGAPTPPDPLGRALTLHAELVRSKTGSFFLVARVSSAWDAALADASLRAELRDRAAAVGASEHALDQVRSAAERELASFARERGVCLADVPEAGPFLRAATQRLRDELLDDIESTCAELARRERELPSADEWAEWNAVRLTLESALRTGGREVRRLAMPTLSRDLASYAVSLFNQRKEKVLANFVFRWLAAEAIAAGDTETADLHGRNAQLQVR